MATLEDCLDAVARLGELLDAATADGHVGDFPDRAVCLELTDLKACIVGALRGGRLADMAPGPGATAPADATLKCSSDTLMALCKGELGFTLAWATGKLAIEASLRDLIRLRSLI